MHEINLLPWREKKLLKQKKMLSIIFLLLLITITCLVALGQQYLSGLIHTESNFIIKTKDEIRAVEIGIIKMEKAKLQLLMLYPHIKMLEKLSRENHLVLHLFPELIKVLPDGIYLNHLKRHGDIIELDGYAEREEDITKLMVSIPNYDWIHKPHLAKVITPKDDFSYAFTLQFTLKAIRPVAASILNLQARPVPSWQEGMTRHE